MARSNIQLEQNLNILLKQYAKGKIRITTVDREITEIKKKLRKRKTGKRKAFILIKRYEAIFKSLRNKKIVSKSKKKLSKRIKKKPKIKKKK